ncbi:MAG TPA: hypothetical protein VKM94_07600 [Blastocatellia bacterium]|nr:hypothetical protein [Blastocatellia bacterium]
MPTVSSGPAMPHRQEMLERRHGYRGKSFTYLIQQEPDILILVQGAKGALLPIFARKQKSRSRNVVAYRPAYLPPSQFKKEKRRQEGDYGATYLYAALHEGGDHRLKEATAVPVVVVHLLAKPPMRSFYTSVELCA